jgi:hypothetical protein
VTLLTFFGLKVCNYLPILGAERAFIQGWRNGVWWTVWTVAIHREAERDEMAAGLDDFGHTFTPGWAERGGYCAEETIGENIKMRLHSKMKIKTDV